MGSGGWPECAPRRVGMRQAQVERAVELMRAYGGTAQLVVLRHGQVVPDRQNHCTPRALFLLLSAGKPIIAMLVHLLAERGVMSLDDPVAAWWPEHASHGKDRITVRHVLTHRAGVPYASGSEYGDALTMTRWDRPCSRRRRCGRGGPPGRSSPTIR